MARMIRARRTGGATTSDTDRLRDQFIRELTQQAQTIMKQMQQDFTRDLEQQGSQVLQGLLGDGNAASTGAGLSGFFSTASRYLFSRPKTTTATKESARSREEVDRFRLSQAQLLAEANATIVRGDKNL